VISKVKLFRSEKKSFPACHTKQSKHHDLFMNDSYIQLVFAFSTSSFGHEGPNNCNLINMSKYEANVLARLDVESFGTVPFFS